MRKRGRWLLIFLSAVVLPILTVGNALAAATQPQDLAPTATLTLPYIECCKNNTQSVNLRAGPSSVWFREVIGVLVLGQTAPVLGKNKGGNWYEIVYKPVPSGVAWVFSDYVILHTSDKPIPVLSDPPTPTAAFQPTLDPTFAAQFSSFLPTRLPTYTAAPIKPTMTSYSGSLTGQASGIPPAAIIIGLVILAMIGGLLSAVVSRR